MPDLEQAPVNLNDLKALHDMKTNKFDTEVIMRGVDIQHKQINLIAILFADALKTLIKDHKESK